VQAAFTPCVVLAARDDEALVDVALAAGATDFLVMAALDVAHLERVVQFRLQRRRVVDALAARESYLAAAQERDRQQLANALHDGPLQDLIGARFLLGALRPTGPTDSIDEIQSSLQGVIQSVRSLCSDLKPPALGPFGLEKAIRAYMQSVQARDSDVVVILELDADHQQLPEWARLALFRVFQAAISNVITHAQASHIWVRMVLNDGEVRMTVADDGKGFDVPSSWLEFARTERCGLLMMQERVDALQGRMMVQSTSGGGTRLLVQVPMDQPPLPLPAYLAPTVP
jgi:signal transduction histidine kinase